MLGIEMSDGWFTFMVVVGWCSVANELMLNPWQRGFFILKHPLVVIEDQNSRKEVIDPRRKEYSQEEDKGIKKCDPP